MGPNQNSSQPQPLTPPLNTQPQTPSTTASAPTPAIPPIAPATEEKKEGSVGALIGSIIIVIIIVLGGLYFWGKALEKKNSAPITPSSNETSLAPEGMNGDDLSAAAGSTTLTKLPPSSSLSATDEIAQIEAALADLQKMNSDGALATLGE